MKRQGNNTDNFRLGLLNFPEEYGPLNKELPADMFPPDAVGCGIRTSMSSGLVFAFSVDERSSMPFDDLEWLINEYHNTMDEFVGLIEVGNGTTIAGNKYVYGVRKLGYPDENGNPDVCYQLNLNMMVGEVIMFVDANFREEGTTGIRDSMIYSLLSGQGKVTFDEEGIIHGWNKDPYDETYDKGFLMNASEAKEYDASFPEHALSVLRKFVDDMVKIN